MPEASKTQLMDLIAAPGQDDIEPTRAASGRQQLYPDVCVVINAPVYSWLMWGFAVSSYVNIARWSQSWAATPGTLQRKPVQLPRSESNTVASFRLS